MGGRKDLDKAAGGHFEFDMRALALEVGGLVAVDVVVQAASDRLRLHLDHMPGAPLAGQESWSQTRQVMGYGDRAPVLVAGPVDHVVAHA